MAQQPQPRQNAHAATGLSIGQSGSTEVGGAIVVSVQSPFGLLLDGTKDMGIYVSTIRPGKSLDKTGQVKEGMRITAVNNADVKGMDKMKITQLIKKSGGNCKFTFVVDETGYKRFVQAKASKGRRTSKAGLPTPAAPPPEKPKRNSKRESTGSTLSEDGAEYNRLKASLRKSKRHPSVETAGN